MVEYDEMIPTLQESSLIFPCLFFSSAEGLIGLEGLISPQYVEYAFVNFILGHAVVFSA